MSGSASRIIPARAGFTDHAAARRLGRPDHPRTRGVYRGYTMHSLRHRGSSPHARGLQGVGGLEAQDGRIIPARAGFTRRESS